MFARQYHSHTQRANEKVRKALFVTTEKKRKEKKRQFITRFHNNSEISHKTVNDNYKDQDQKKKKIPALPCSLFDSFIQSLHEISHLTKNNISK